MSDKTINKDSLLGKTDHHHIERFQFPSFSNKNHGDMHVRLHDYPDLNNKKINSENFGIRESYLGDIKENDKHVPPFMDPEWSSLIDTNSFEERSNHTFDVSIGKHFRHYKDTRKLGEDRVNFWFEDPKSLIKTLDTVPNDNMSDAERLNAMTRMIIIITAVMFVIKFPLWWLFLGLGLMVVVIFWYIIKGYEEIYANQVRKQREYLRPRRESIVRPLNSIIRPIKRELNTDNSPFSKINNMRSLNIISRKR